MSQLQSRRTEFEAFVWDHAADPFQASFDERRELSQAEKLFLIEVHKIVVNPDDSSALKSLTLIINNNREYFALLLQIVGLTRNKIISDLRGSEALKKSNIPVPSSYAGVPGSRAWEFAGPYILKRLRGVVGIVDPTKPMIGEVFEALNQSTWPGYVRQERAKRSGHEAEYRLATLFSSLRIPFSPVEKSENPLCRDVQIAGISFDLVVPNERSPLVVFKATVHTANIGQYGESKDHLEVDEARRWLDGLDKRRRPLLVALIDGVGFRSNRAGLNGVLEKSDEFCQFRTIWKAVIVAASRSGMRFDVVLPKDQINTFSNFLDRYGYKNYCRPRETVSNIVGFVEAGDAFIRPG
jgi:hypothetical protein